MLVKKRHTIKGPEMGNIMRKMRESVIAGVLTEELERNEKILIRYYEELSKLPKGSLMLRKVNDREYYYLKYRDDGKVVSKYLGPKDRVNIEEVKKAINKRKEMVTVIKRLEDEKKEISKMLKVRV